MPSSELGTYRKIRRRANKFNEKVNKTKLNEKWAKNVKIYTVNGDTKLDR